MALLVAAAAPLRAAGTATPSAALRLWYDTPATAFEEALPLGNGRIGAMVFGGATTERILLNESTLWAGGPIDPEVNPEAIKALPAVRQALFAGDYARADQLTRKLQGRFAESYAPLGDLFIDTAPGPGSPITTRTRPRLGDGAHLVRGQWRVVLARLLRLVP
jgi:hypothetical protein